MSCHGRRVRGCRCCGCSRLSAAGAQSALAKRRALLQVFLRFQAYEGIVRELERRSKTTFVKVLPHKIYLQTFTKFTTLFVNSSRIASLAGHDSYYTCRTFHLPARTGEASVHSHASELTSWGWFRTTASPLKRLIMAPKYSGEELSLY
jgi:hypothetical protein